MKLSDIEKNILNYLVHEGEYATAKKISSELEVSTRTIYRGIKSLREKIDSKIIISNRSKGYKLDYEKYLDILNQHYMFNDQYMTIESRRMLILYKLLINSPNMINIIDLSIDYYVSESSIINDLDFINQKIKSEKLELIRKANDVYIKGSERNVRKELMRIINSFLVDTDTPSLSALTSKDSHTHYLSTYFDKDDVDKVTSILEDAMEMMDSKIENPYYTNLLTHLLILLKRKNYIKRNKATYDIKNIKEDKYEVARFIIRSMEKMFDIEIKSEEVNYVYTFLVSSRIDISQNNLTGVEIKTNNTAEKFVEELVTGMEEDLNVNFSKDCTLRKSLLQHVNPMFNRLKYNVIIINPLIDDIKTEFSDIFDKLKNILNKLSKKYALKNLSDDEVGYLTIYFQNALEKVGKQLNVLIVCTTGVGTSHLLKTRVKNHFPILNIKDLISLNELESYNDSKIDLILTTINLPPTEAPQLIISALLDKGDINIINQFIKKIMGV